MREVTVCAKELGTMSKYNLRGITLGERSIWGFNSLTRHSLLLPCVTMSELTFKSNISHRKLCLKVLASSAKKHIWQRKIIIKNSRSWSQSRESSCTYWLLTKLFRSRWQDIGQVLFLFLLVYGPTRSQDPKRIKKKGWGPYTAILTEQACWIKN